MIDLRKKDPVADAIKQILEKDLSPKQKKIAKMAGDPDKIDAQDLAALRAGKKPTSEETVEENAFDYTSPRKPEPNGGSGVKKGTRYGGSKQKDKPEQDEDKMKKEEVEQIDEISDKTLSSYVSAARKDREHNKINKAAPDTAQRAAANERDKKRIAGMNKAKSYLTPGTVGYAKNQARRSANEEVEQIEEGMKTALKKLGKKTFKAFTGGSDEDQRKDLQRKMGVPQTGKKPTSEEVVTEAKGIPVAHGYVMHQKHSGKYRVHSPSGEHVGDVEKEGSMWRYHGSSNPNWPGTETHKDYQTDKVENKHEAGDIVAHLHHNGSMKKEEVEQIDELSKSTLGSYVKKASDDAMVSRKLGSDFANKAKRVKSDSAKGANTRLADRFNNMATKRRAGVGKAVDRLTKEEVESLDEGKMDHMSLTHLWHAHAKHTYASDQGYGHGDNSMRLNHHAATAIENHVRKHHGNKVADDMLAHSDNHVAHAEYVGGKEAKEVEKSAEKLRKKHGIKGNLYGHHESVNEEVQIDEKAPPGFEGTVKAMKKHKEITNPFALAWSMKNKGYKSHKKSDGSDK